MLNLTWRGRLYCLVPHAAHGQVLPIAGNACEHITAVVVAVKNKMDLSLGVAVGSSIQIAVFAIPFVVLAGWVLGKPFSLDFDPFAVLVLMLSVIHANFVTSDARSHWLSGVVLVAAYVVIAVVYLGI
jgi:Ca2+:H+ antiporter